MAAKNHATLEDLYRVPGGKAETVDGEVKFMSPTGDLPSSAAGEVFVSLRGHSARTGRGRAYTENAAVVVNLPNRRSFSPDVAWYVGGRKAWRLLRRRGFGGMGCRCTAR